MKIPKSPRYSTGGFPSCAGLQPLLTQDFLRVDGITTDYENRTARLLLHVLGEAHAEDALHPRAPRPAADDKPGPDIIRKPHYFLVSPTLSVMRRDVEAGLGLQLPNPPVEKTKTGHPSRFEPGLTVNPRRRRRGRRCLNRRHHVHHVQLRTRTLRQLQRRRLRPNRLLRTIRRQQYLRREHSPTFLQYIYLAHRCYPMKCNR